MPDGASFTVPSQTHVDSWTAGRVIQKTRKAKVDLFPIPSCPVEVLRKLKVNVGIEGFCSGLRPESYIGHGDKKSLSRNKPKEIAAIIASTPKGKFDSLEPRPWLSWSDCFILDRDIPAIELRRFEECPFCEIDTISALDELYGIIR